MRQSGPSHPPCDRPHAWLAHRLRRRCIRGLTRVRRLCCLCGRVLFPPLIALEPIRCEVEDGRRLMIELRVSINLLAPSIPTCGSNPGSKRIACC